MPIVDYISEGYPAGAPVTNGSAALSASWDDLLWAAVTVGRPNRLYVFQHGLSSMYEALFRWSLVRMALEQSGPRGQRFRRTAAARNLDPSEKGAVNYFLGMATCKLFAARLLDARWLLHLDVFRPALDPVLSGRSRPDLVGQTVTGDWLAFESKGRASAPHSDTKDKAKVQVQRCVSVNGTPVCYHVGGIAYFKRDVLWFWWRDPMPQQPKQALELSVSQEQWQHHYMPVLALIQADSDQLERMLAEQVVMPVEHLDIQTGVFPQVLTLLTEGQWGEAKQWCAQNGQKLQQAGYHGDGVRVIAGQSWLQPFAQADQGQ